jgi:hypothetical protein
MSQNV